MRKLRVSALLQRCGLIGHKTGAVTVPLATRRGVYWRKGSDVWHCRRFQVVSGHCNAEQRPSQLDTVLAQKASCERPPCQLRQRVYNDRVGSTQRRRSVPQQVNTADRGAAQDGLFTPSAHD